MARNAAAGSRPRIPSTWPTARTSRAKAASWALSSGVFFPFRSAVAFAAVNASASSASTWGVLKSSSSAWSACSRIGPAPGGAGTPAASRSAFSSVS